MHFSVGFLSSLLLSAFLAFSFVLSLYVWRHSTRVDRDHPAVIKQRLISILSVCVLGPILLYFLALPDSAAPFSFLALIGFPLSGLLPALVLPLLLTAILFTGPLFTHFLEHPRPSLPSLSEYHDEQRLFIAIRNLLAAPFCEEFIFRGLICSLLISGGWSFAASIIISPLLFGIAHMHHLIGLVRARGVSLKQGALIVLFQLFYTTLFGLYASFLFLRTGHVMSVFLCHSFCNMLGFPALDWLSNPHHSLFKHRMAIAAAFLTGIIAFSMLLHPLTEPQLFDSWTIQLIERRAQAAA